MLKHLMGILFRPDKEWAIIDHEETGSLVRLYLTHVMILAAIPAISGYIGSALVGWKVGTGDPVKLNADVALIMAILGYIALCGGVAVMGIFIHWMAKTYGSDPSLYRCIVLSAYTATPLFIIAILAIYPVLWILMLGALAAIAHAVYLLYHGIPIMMHIPKEQGFLYASSVLTASLVVLVASIAGMVILISTGVSFTFVS
ncbi:MAG TPA: Yip1 family protein [Pseudomonadales bacterium]